MVIRFVEEYPIGARVVLYNIVKSPDMNGRTGTVQSRLKHNNGRQAISLSNAPPPPRRRQEVAIKPDNLRFEPHPIESLSETDMILILQQKGVDTDSGTMRSLSKSELRSKVSAAFHSSDAAIDDNNADSANADDDDAVALEIGRILGLDAAEKATMNEIKAEKDELPDHIDVDHLFKHQLKAALEGADPLPCLGGMPEKGGLKLPQDSFYARSLDRPANLGPLKMCNGRFESSRAERVFRTLSEGNCSIVWGVDAEKDELTILVFEDENSQDARMYINIKQQYNVDIGRYNAIACGAWLWAALLSHIGQIESLRYRILHRFLRCYGYLLPTKQQNDVFVLLQKNYTRDKQWKSYLDLSITMADTAFNTGHPVCASALIRVGEALEATGRFAKASIIYKEIGILLANGTLSNNSGYVSMVMCHDYAGTALDRCGKTAAAEEEFFLALKADYEQTGSIGSDGLRVWNVNQDRTAELWHKMLTMHDRFVEATIAASGSREGHICISNVDDNEKLQLAWMAMPGLLTVAGFSNPMPSNAKYGATFHKLALERYKYSPQAATHALARAVDESQSAKDFCHSLVGTLNERIVAECSIRFGRLGGPANTVASGPLSEKSLRESGKQEARDFASSTYGDYVITNCQNPSCPKQKEKLRGDEAEAKNKYCPCQGAQYCSRGCQKAHWSIHKKTCPYGKGKK